MTTTTDEDLVRLTDLLVAGIPSAEQTIRELIAYAAGSRTTEPVPDRLPATSRPRPGDLGEHPERWWDSHDEGTHGRPRPGTRVHIRGHDGVVRQAGTVDYYEGIWPCQHSFPVRWDFGVHESLSTSHEDLPLGWDYEDSIDRVAAVARHARRFGETAS